MDFHKWAKDNGLNNDTVFRLQEDDFGDIETLRNCTEDDFAALELPLEQTNRLNAALERLPAPYIEDEFDAWSSSHKLKPETVQTLKDGGYTDLTTLSTATQDDLKAMNIRGGQLVKLKQGIVELNESAASLSEESKLGTQSEESFQDGEIRDFLAAMGLQNATISKLINQGFGSVEALISLDDCDLEVMQIEPEDQIILKAKAKQLNRTYIESTDVDTGEIAIGELEAVAEGGKSWLAKKKTTLMNLGAKSGIGTFVRYMVKQGVKFGSLQTTYVNGMRIKQLPLKEDYVDNEKKIRRCVIGSQSITDSEKTILVVGATGTGKSTLINGLVNYIFGTKWPEKHRLKLIDQHPDEIHNAEVGQSQSQTEWITIYRMPSCITENLPYILNLIDTPGFGATQGFQRDQELVEQIRVLFANCENHGIDSIDAVCFVVKSSDARLTKIQEYIFNSILSIFGKNIKENIIIMITHADGERALVLDALKEVDVPHNDVFLFNNSALFANNCSSKEHDEAMSNFSKMFWAMGIASYKKFFESLDKLQPKSLQLTAEVLENRRILKDILQHLQKKIQTQLSIMSSLDEERHILQQHEAEIKKNLDFQYEVDEEYKEKKKLSNGKRSNYCHRCDDTCHANCYCRGPKTKYFCDVFTWGGYCKLCSDKCLFTEHEIVDYIIQHNVRRVTRTYKEKFETFYRETRKALDVGSVIKSMQTKYNEHTLQVKDYFGRCQDILKRLDEIALKPDPISESAYVDELIKIEQHQQKPGWIKRINELTNIQKIADTLRHMNNEENSAHSEQPHSGGSAMATSGFNPPSVPDANYRLLAVKENLGTNSLANNNSPCILS